MQKKHLTKPNTLSGKNIQQTRSSGEFFNLIKDVFEKPTTNVLFNGEMLSGFPQNQEQDTKPILTTSVQHCIREENEPKHPG